MPFSVRGCGRFQELIRFARESPQTNKGIRSLAVTLRQPEIGEIHLYLTLLIMLVVTSCLMLLICCGNVAGLLFARAAQAARDYGSHGRMPVDSVEAVLTESRI